VADKWKDAARLAGSGTLLSPAVFTIGFARRFATYKRADLLLRDKERLRRLLTDPSRPVQIVFAGKAHPADDPGKRVLQQVFLARRIQLRGPDRVPGRLRDAPGAPPGGGRRRLAQLPRVPLEACGTSGMKAALNGVPQLGTLDGWWAEGYTGQNGWAIPLASGRATLRPTSTTGAALWAARRHRRADVLRSPPWPALAGVGTYDERRADSRGRALHHAADAPDVRHTVLRSRCRR